MATTIIGSAINTKVLKRQNFNKEINGLETLIEAYAIKTSNRVSVVPAKDTLHSAFSSASTTYTRMAVESVATEEEDGGITSLLVTYVGLTSSTGLPPAVVRLIPTAGAGVYGPPLVIEVEFVTDVTESQFASGQQATTNPAAYSGGWTTFIPMPASINGTALPVNIRKPFNNNGLVIERYYGYCADSFSCERRGLFLVAKNIYAEKQEIATIS
jgi:hypothetical protein